MLGLLAGCSEPTIVSTPAAGDGTGGSGAAGQDEGQRGAGGGAGEARGGSGPTTDFKLDDGGVKDPAAALGDGGGCNKLEVRFDKVIPTVAVVVDRSSSMFEAYDRVQGNRWDVLKKALVDPTSGLLKRNEADVRFGLFMFTSTSKEPTCPAIGKVSFAIGNFAAIQTLYGPAKPPSLQEKGETPTGETIAAVTDELLKINEPGPKYVLLATDGEPDTCPGTCTGNDCPVPDKAGWPRDPNCGHDRSLSAVQEAFKKGIKTFVLALGNEVGAEHLQSLANAGAGLPVALGKQADMLRNDCRLPSAMWKGTYATSTDMKAKFYRPTDADALASDLKTIIDDVRGCTFMLKGVVDLPTASSGQVRLGDRALGYGDANGWRMNSTTELEVLGSACQEIKAGGKALQVAFPCGSIKLIQ